MRATSRDSEHIWKAIGGLVWVNHLPPGIFDAVGVQQSSTLRGSSAKKRKKSERVRGRRNIWLFCAKAVLIVVVHEVDDASGTHFEKQVRYSQKYGGSGTEFFIFYQNFNSNLVS